MPRETSLHFPPTESGNVLWSCFVGQNCDCSPHESVLFLFSSMVVTHGNMPFGKGAKEGGRLSEDCSANDSINSERTSQCLYLRLRCKSTSKYSCIVSDIRMAKSTGQLQFHLSLVGGSSQLRWDTRTLKLVSVFLFSVLFQLLYDANYNDKAGKNQGNPLIRNQQHATYSVTVPVNLSKVCLSTTY